MNEETLSASYPAAPAPAAGEQSPEEKAAAAVAAYLGPKKVDHAPASPAPVPAARPDAARPAPAAPVGEKPGEVAAAETPATEPYQLEAPADLPRSLSTDENRSILNGFTEAASSAGIPQPVAESLFEAYIDVQTILDYGAPSQFSTGDEYTPADAERVLRRIWGTEYDAKLAEVRKTVRGLGSKFDDWLNETQMGNNPATIIALSMYPDTKLSKAQAADELKKLTADKRYLAGDKITVARAKLLGRIVYAA